MKNSLTIGLALVTVSFSALAQTTYNGNAATGFGGSIGNGTLVVSDSGPNVTFTLNAAGSLGGNDLVVYIDSVAGGFSSTTGFNDDADGGRSAVSGYTSTSNGGGPGQSILTFASGFNADYAIDIQSGYASLFGLVNGGSGSLNYITGISQSGSSPYSLTLSLADLGLTAGQSFELFGTLVSESGYRSTEAVAGNDTSAANAQGWIPFTQTSFATYTTSAVPEPSVALLGMVGLATVYLVRRRR